MDHVLHGKKTVLSNSVKRRGQEIEKWLSCRTSKIIFLTIESQIECLSCSAGPVKLSHHPVAPLSAKIGALDPSNNRNRCLEILGAAAEALNNYAQKELFAYGDFLILKFSEHNHEN